VTVFGTEVLRPHGAAQLLGPVLDGYMRNTPEALELADYGCGTMMHLVEINAQPLDGESNSRDFDFSRAAIHARWQAGYADTHRMITRRPWDDPVDPMVGVTVHASDANG